MIHADEPALLRDAIRTISGRWPGRPAVGIVLGTGADDLARQIRVQEKIPYGEIPGFSRSTAPGHAGELLCGILGEEPVVAMRGRFHLYEGYSFNQVRFPLAVMANLGVQTLLLSNAAGGLNPRFASGDLMAICSHIDLMFRRWGSRCDDGLLVRTGRRADVVYDPGLIDLAQRAARAGDFVLHRGVYAALTGPNYETGAEYRFLRRIGADVVGMSTIPEVIAAAELGMRVAAFSIVANVAKPDVLQPTSATEVVDAASVAASRLSALMVHLIRHEAASSRVSSR